MDSKRTEVAPRVAADSQLAVAAIPFGQIEKMAAAFAKSQLFGIKNQEQALVLMLMAQADGLHPAAAARDYHIIGNKPAIKASAALARFQRSGGSVKWVKYTDEEVIGEFYHPKGGSLNLSWDIQRAKEKGLYDRNPNYKIYPRNMLRSRCISEAVQTLCPEEMIGVMTVEEAEDVAISEGAAPPIVGKVEDRIESPNRLTDTEVNFHIQQIESASSETLRDRFTTAWREGGNKKDADAQSRFKAAYDKRKEQIEAAIRGDAQ